MAIVHGVILSNARATTWKNVQVGSSASLEAIVFRSPLGLLDGEGNGDGWSWHGLCPRWRLGSDLDKEA